MAQKKDDIASTDRLHNYSNVVESASLGAIQLLELNFSVKPEYFRHHDAVRLSYDTDIIETEYSQEADMAVAMISCQVVARLKRKTVLSCAARYAVTYEFDADCDREAVFAFLKRVAVFACYPYFRAMMANVDWAAHTKLPVLPVLKEKVTPKRIAETPIAKS
jgi:preprotein translocase subunit SecB